MQADARGADFAELTLIVPTLNEERHVGTLLTSVMRQSADPSRFRVIVVDGCSTDRTISEIERVAAAERWSVSTEAGPLPRKTIGLLTNSHKTTPWAFNLGIQSAATRFVGLVGAHSLLPADYVECVLAGFAETGADIVGGRPFIVGADGSIDAISCAQSSRLAMGSAGYLCSKSVADVDTVPFPAFSRALWQDLGGFDIQLVRNQDDDFTRRARGRGYRVTFVPSIGFRYFARSDLRSLWRQFYRYGFFRVSTSAGAFARGSVRSLAPVMLLACLAPSLVVFLGRKKRIAALPTLGYLGVLSLDSWLDPRCPTAHAPRRSVALATMHLAYGSGEVAGGFARLRNVFFER